MQASPELRKKLVLVIGNLVSRCMEEARNIPYILRQEELLELLIGNPERFGKLVEEERFDRTEYSSGTLTAKLDALSELGQFESLDTYHLSWTSSESDIRPAIEQINRLSRTFAVYVGNTVALFEREFEILTARLSKLLSKSGMELKAVEFIEEDLAEMEARAVGHLASGRFLHAFLFERLLSCHVITKKAVVLPENYSLRAKLLRRVINDSDLFPMAVRFILRAEYISQGGWDDLVAQALSLMSNEHEARHRSVLIDLIEEDSIFSCNLLCGSFGDLKNRSAQERRAEIEEALRARTPNDASLSSA